MTADNYRRVGRLVALAADAGMPLTRMALAWTLRLENVASAITGASRLSPLEENVLAADTRLDAELCARIEEALSDGVH